jgi:hypothetical protein
MDNRNKNKNRKPTITKLTTATTKNEINGEK